MTAHAHSGRNSIFSAAKCRRSRCGDRLQMKFKKTAASSTNVSATAAQRLDKNRTWAPDCGRVFTRPPIAANVTAKHKKSRNIPTFEAKNRQPVRMRGIDVHWWANSTCWFGLLAGERLIGSFKLNVFRLCHYKSRAVTTRRPDSDTLWMNDSCRRHGCRSFACPCTPRTKELLKRDSAGQSATGKQVH